MKEFTVGKNDANQRLDRWLSKNLPLLPAPLAQKYIRLKRVKLNGKGAKRDTRLQVGDLLQLYINDEFFEIPTPENAFLKLFKPKLDILYEDEHILLVNKAPGMVVHGDETERVNTLINHIQAYLYQKKEWNPFREHAFAPALCNRIDRNTGGIVIAAKTAEALRVMNQKIRDRELVKYVPVCHCGADPAAGWHAEGVSAGRTRPRSRSLSSPVPCPAPETAVTIYRTLTSGRGLSLVECDLITGRTHQIRAQLAAAGHPLLGDGKYGSEKLNRRYGMRRQALWSWSLEFRFTTPAGELEYLNGQRFQVSAVDFAAEYFPDYPLAQAADYTWN